MTSEQQPSAAGARFDDNGRKGVLAILETATVTQLRTGQPVFLDLQLIDMGPWPLALIDGEWMAQHPDIGMMAPGPVVTLTEQDFTDLAAGKTVDRPITQTPLWDAFRVRLSQTETLEAVPQRFAQMADEAGRKTV